MKAMVVYDKDDKTIVEVFTYGRYGDYRTRIDASAAANQRMRDDPAWRVGPGALAFQEGK